MDTKEHEEYIEALKELKGATHELYLQTLATSNAINNVLNNSHLRSTLSLLKEDIGVRRLIDLQV